MQARIAHIGQMLYSRGAGEASKVQDLAARLDELTRFPPAEPATQALSSAMTAAIGGTGLSQEASGRLASRLYVLMNGGYLTRPHLEDATRDLERELGSAGVAPAAAAAVGAAGFKVARESRNPRTDWW